LSGGLLECCPAEHLLDIGFHALPNSPLLALNTLLE
jgi:hypothetical protein